ncbi:MAG: DCC1-like thiol-disulfide oxidoreductase family protein [Nitrososphaerales archaeon]
MFTLKTNTGSKVAISSNLEQATSRKYLVFYDSDCSVCIKFRKTVEFLDSRNRLTFLPLSHASSVVDMPESRLYQSFHFLNSKGEITSGSESIPQLISELPACLVLSKIIFIIPSGQRLIRFVYSTLSRLHQTGSCSSARA